MPTTNQLNAFHTLVGKTLMCCQRIENDIKWIYAGMVKGDFFGNYEGVKRKPLGDVLVDLEALDNSDGHPYLSANDYRLLDQIRRIRNRLAHETYTAFIYESNAEKMEEKFRGEYSWLYDEYTRLCALSDSVERTKMDVLKKYKRKK